MEVKNSEASKESTDMQAAMEATAKIGWGPISATVKITGSVSSHKENTRSTDQSAKYHVEVHASDDGMPRSEEHTSELQSLMRSTYSVFCMTQEKLRQLKR